MTKKTALFVLALMSAAQADSSCDVTSRLYGGVGLGFSNAHAPILKHKGLGAAFDNKFKKLSPEELQSIDPSKMKSGVFYKKMRALSGRLALGGHFVVPNTWLVLGAEASFGLGGAKGQIKENLANTNISKIAPAEADARAEAALMQYTVTYANAEGARRTADAATINARRTADAAANAYHNFLDHITRSSARVTPASIENRHNALTLARNHEANAAAAVAADTAAFVAAEADRDDALAAHALAEAKVAAAAAANAKGAYTLAVRDRWNMALTGIVGAKVGRFLPYAKVGVVLHSFKVTKNLSGTYGGKSFNQATTTRKKKALFVMGLGVDCNVTKNIVVGAEWSHHRGSLGLINKAERKVASKQNKKMDKIRTNEFMVTCKYAFPVN